jgi:polyphosphate kinase 2 (PPK2 family)
MFARTNHADGPWRLVAADVKKAARLELIRDLLASFDYPAKMKKLAQPDRQIVRVLS